jgi:hypothetical protein
MILNLISYVGIWVSSSQLWSLLAFAVNDHAWVGNLDGIVVWGMALSRLSNAYVVGTGLLLISIKPQYFPMGLYYIWRCRNYRMLVVPLIGLVLSFVFLGNWLPEWLATLPPTPPEHINVSFFPWTLPLWLLLPFAADKERFILAVAIISVPYFNQVSLFTLFAFRWHKWVIIPLILLSWVAPLWLAPFVVIYALLITPDQKIANVIWPIIAKIHKNCAEIIHSKNLY